MAHTAVRSGIVAAIARKNRVSLHARCGRQPPAMGTRLVQVGRMIGDLVHGRRVLCRHYMIKISTSCLHGGWAKLTQDETQKAWPL